MPTERQLHRLYFAVVREAALQGLEQTAKEKPAVAARLETYRTALTEACTQAGEYAVFMKEIYRRRSQELMKLVDPKEPVAAVQIIAALLALQVQDKYEDEPGESASLLPPQDTLKHQPRLLQALYYLVRTDAESTDHVEADFAKFLKLLLPLIDGNSGSLPVPAGYSPVQTGAAAPTTADPALVQQAFVAELIYFLQIHPHAILVVRPVVGLRATPQWAWLGCLAEGIRERELAWKARGSAPRKR